MKHLPACRLFDIAPVCYRIYTCNKSRFFSLQFVLTLWDGSISWKQNVSRHCYGFWRNRETKVMIVLAYPSVCLSVCLSTKHLSSCPTAYLSITVVYLYVTNLPIKLPVTYLSVYLSPGTYLYTIGSVPSKTKNLRFRKTHTQQSLLYTEKWQSNTSLVINIY